MLSKGVAGINQVGLPHEPVPGHLGHDGRSGYGVAEAIALDQGLKRERALFQADEIQQQIIWLYIQVSYGLQHCPEIGLLDAYEVYLLRALLGHSDGR